MTTLFNNLDPSLRKKIGWAAAGVGVFITATMIYSELTKFNIKDKVVLITGGSRGLGLALAKQLGARGAKLALCARSGDQLERARAALQSLGYEVKAFVADVTNENEVNTLIRSVVQEYGQLDVLINNAGIIQVGPQETMTKKDYEDAMQTHFWAPLYTMQAVLPQFTEQGEGHIVNITSIGGKIAVPHMLPYTSSKFAMVGLSEGMQAELKKHNIHVSTVVPNLMRTGSQPNITVKGNHEAEYAWFKVSGSSPLISQDVEHAARRIVKVLEYGEAEAILSLTGKVATVIKGVAPGWVNLLLSLANRFLPANVPGGIESKKGYEAESKLSRGPVATLSDKASDQYNER